MPDKPHLDEAAPPPSSDRTNHGAAAQQHRAAIDQGRTHDKIPVIDPATTPLGTDSEAAGSSMPEGSLEPSAPAAKPSAPTGHPAGTPPGIPENKVPPGSYSDYARAIVTRGWAVVLTVAVAVIVVGLLVFALVA